MMAHPPQGALRKEWAEELLALHLIPKMLALAADAVERDLKDDAQQEVKSRFSREEAVIVLQLALSVITNVSALAGAMLDIEGAPGPEDVVLVGDEAALDAALERLEASGVTEFVAAPFAADDGAVERTRAYLADRAI